MLLSGLYYPHTQLSTYEPAAERLLKRALLLWDHLEFIVPEDRYQTYYPDGNVSEAIEIIGKKHVPSAQEKQEAHERIEELLTRPGLVPEAFLYRGSDPYEIYPEKFMEETWKLLKESKFAGELMPQGPYAMNPQVGLTMMAILADCCAGTTLNRVTDRAQAYAGLTGLFGDQGEDTSLLDRTVDSTLRLFRPAENLVSLRLSMLDIDRISLDQLVEFRKREAAEGGHTLRDLRHRYAQRIENQVQQIAGNEGGKELTPSDIAELERRFAQENEDDLSQLMSELRAEAIQGVLSKDVVVTFLGVAGLAASLVYPPAAALQGVLSPAGGAVSVGGIVAARSKYLKARSDVLRKHPMAYIYELGKS